MVHKSRLKFVEEPVIFYAFTVAIVTVVVAMIVSVVVAVVVA